MLEVLRSTQGETGKPVRIFPIAFTSGADSAVLRTIAEATNSAVVQRSRPQDDQQGLHRGREQLLGPCGSASAIASSARGWPGPSPPRRPSSPPARRPRSGCVALRSARRCSAGLLGYAGAGRPGHPPGRPRPRIDPFGVKEPWRQFVGDALQARRRFDEAIRDMAKGPLQDRLLEIGGRLDTGVEEVWNIAKRGPDPRRRPPAAEPRPDPLGDGPGRAAGRRPWRPAAPPSRPSSRSRRSSTRPSGWTR